MFEKNSVYSEVVLNFVKVASDFLEFADAIDGLDRKSFIEKAIALLPNLYSKTVSLPDFGTYEGVEKYCSQYDWERIQTSVSQKLGEHESYYDITEPQFYQTGDTVNVSTSESFADIYQSVFDFMSFYRITDEEGMKAAVAEYKQEVANFAGVRILRLTEELHLMLHGVDDLTEEQSEEHYNNFLED